MKTKNKHGNIVEDRENTANEKTGNLMAALLVVDKEIGPKSIAAAQLLHRIGLEFCKAGKSSLAKNYCAEALSIVEAHSPAILLGKICVD